MKLWYCKEKETVNGVHLSPYAIENGYLDYYTLGKLVDDRILNNNIFSETIDQWELYNGYDDEDEDGNYQEVYQWYIISDYGAEFLQSYTTEIVYYNDNLDMYLWGITHFGTSWDYVLTDIKLDKLDKMTYQVAGARARVQLPSYLIGTTVYHI